MYIRTAGKKMFLTKNVQRVNIRFYKENYQFFNSFLFFIYSSEQAIRYVLCFIISNPSTVQRNVMCVFHLVTFVTVQRFIAACLAIECKATTLYYNFVLQIVKIKYLLETGKTSQHQIKTSTIVRCNFYVNSLIDQIAFHKGYFLLEESTKLIVHE